MSRIPQACHHGADRDSGKVKNMTGNDDLVQVLREEEIREAIAQLKNNNAQREDEIMAEMLKLGIKPTVQWLTQLSHSIWDSAEVPED